MMAAAEEEEVIQEAHPSCIGITDIGGGMGGASAKS